MHVEPQKLNLKAHFLIKRFVYYSKAGVIGNCRSKRKERKKFNIWHALKYI